tara:strand:+ start:633 stop:1121 length:489 start_codon:yes stop_codon:yes gene_type:complete
MILQYFKKKENTYKVIGDKIYISILSETKLLIKKKYFKNIDFNLSFELISIFIIYYLKELKNRKQIKYKKINTEIVNNLVTDLDNTFREIGIGDMSIGKHVKKYVKKFYYRVKKFDLVLNNNEYSLEGYLNSIKNIDNDHTLELSNDLRDIFKKINKNLEKL